MLRSIQHGGITDPFLRDGSMLRIKHKLVENAQYVNSNCNYCLCNTI